MLAHLKISTAYRDIILLTIKSGHALNRIRRIPHPSLLIIAILLERVVISSTQIGLAQSWRSILVLSLLAVVIIWLIEYKTRDWQYANFLVLMVCAMFLLYRYLYRQLKINLPQAADPLAIVLIVILAVICLVFVNRKAWGGIRNPARLTFYFTVVCAVLLSFQVFRLASDFYNLFMTGTHSQTTAVSELPGDIYLKGTTNPDIYVIVLDGYARQDILENLYHYDNSEFIGQLEELGFHVADQSHSNYIQTAYSMAAFWNFDYLEPWNSSYDYSHYLLDPIRNNRVFRLLDEIGYTTVSFEGGVDYIEIKNSDEYLSNFLPLNKFESLILVDSPLEPFINSFNWPLPVPGYKTHVQRLRYQLKTLKELPRSIPGPKIVYVHILAPHPPFVFDRDGNVIRRRQPYNLGDNPSYTGGLAEYRNGYVDQVIFINSEIMDVVTNILSLSETPPIILIAGDHGPASMFNWRLDTPGCIWERTSNLYAILLPGDQAEDAVDPSLSLVNTFRVIFNTYFGTSLPLLENKTFLMSWQQPTLKIDVTDKTDSRDGCTVDVH